MNNRLASNEMEFVLCEIKAKLFKKRIIQSLKKNNYEDVKTIMTYLEKNPINVFPYKFVDKYHVKDICVNKDDETGLLYGKMYGRRIYLKKSYTFKYHAARYLNTLFMEQDQESPHCYTDENFAPDENTIIIDIGGAEGFFGLKYIDQVKHIFVFECDKDWVEAMKFTYADYSDKVTFIQKYASDRSDEKHATLDEIIEQYGLWDEKIYIKMDAEADELRILDGAQKTFETMQYVKLNVCVYHKQDHEQKVRERFAGWKITAAKGYMLYYYDFDFKEPYLRRGVLRIEK